MILFLLLTLAAAPTVSDLQPRGAQKGRPFQLTLAGRDLVQGAILHSTLPATFTPLANDAKTMEGRGISYLVEPKANVEPGVYPIRVETSEGISNVQLLVIGTFPELQEEESQPGSLPHRNDSQENAQPLPTANVTVTGTLSGAERDVYRIQGKAGEKRVFEVEARRCGSAIDPVIRVTDSAGKSLAKAEDALLLGLDARLEVTFPKDGFYYVEVHDARFSTQTANFYRLKTGQYTYPTEIYPLGGQRGQKVSVSLGPTSQQIADLSSTDANAATTSIASADPATLPLPFAIGAFPEQQEANTSIALNTVVNGKIAKPGEADRFVWNAKPGEAATFELQARELGTSRLTGVITVLDSNGKKLASAGDVNAALGVNTVALESRTSGDPILRFEAPKDLAEPLTITIEDLAGRGGPGFAYRLIARQGNQDFAAFIGTPYVNIPAGASVGVPVTIDRRGYLGPIKLSVANLPKGIRAEGGNIPQEIPDPATPIPRFAARRAMLVLSADEGLRLPLTELKIVATGTLPDGTQLEREAIGSGFQIAVNGATTQGVVDRQRPLIAPWLGMQLPAATTKFPGATLEISLANRVMKPAGEEFLIRYEWKTRVAAAEYPATLSADLVNAGDLRIIDFKPDPEQKGAGTFLITTTKNTYPASYDLYVTGRLMMSGQPVDIAARPISIEVKEVPSEPAPVAR